MPPPALLLIDVQQGIDDPRWGPRSTPGAEARIAELLAAWRAAALPVLHVRHASTRDDSALRPEAPGFDFKPEALPRAGEPVFTKQAGSAFVGTGLDAHLREHGLLDLVVAGLTTEHCVSSSVRAAADLGFRVTVVADACAAFGLPGPNGTLYPADVIHGTALASLAEESAAVSTTADVIASLLRPPAA